MNATAHTCRNSAIRLAAIVFLAVTLALTAYPITVLADSISDVFIDVQIHADGSATLTELWELDITNPNSTEWYLDRYNLDNMEIRDLAVTEILADGTERQFETLAGWDVNKSRAQKAYTCGLTATKEGYELCWGFGENGRHTYRVSYTITNLVKGYQGGDAMAYQFIGNIAGAKQVDFRLAADDTALENPQTRIWVFGYEAYSEFVDGEIVITGNGRFSGRDYAAIMLVLEPGLLSPADVRSSDVQELIDKNMEGSFFPDSEGINSGFARFLLRIFGPETTVKILLLFSVTGWPVLFPLLAVLMAFWILLSSHQREKRALRPAFKINSKVGYCRDLPFTGSLSAAYTALYSDKLVSETVVIGCILLKWVETSQIEIQEETVGVVRKKQAPVVHLHPARPDMPPMEKQLYDMMLKAAGSDQILQSRELEKWAGKQYDTISSWLSSYRSQGMAELKHMGVYKEVKVKRKYSFGETTRNQKTDYGRDLFIRAMGFARYLNDFTILAEREAPEVKLWDEYLIFAHLFGMADKVAEQFAKLYPKYLADPDAGNHVHDSYHQNHYHNLLYAASLSNTVSWSVSKAYRSEELRRQSSDSSSSSGGGGSSSSSGGGGSSSGSGGSSSR